HVHHIVFGLNASAAWIRGDRTKHDWQQSWRVKGVDEAGWAELLRQLRAGYADLREAIEKQGVSSSDAFGGAVGAVAHVAYHLGAIRQKMAGPGATGGTA